MFIWGKGRAAGQVGSGRVILFVGNQRVGSGQRFAGSGPRKGTRGQLCHRYADNGAKWGVGGGGGAVAPPSKISKMIYIFLMFLVLLIQCSICTYISSFSTI